MFPEDGKFYRYLVLPSHIVVGINDLEEVLDIEYKDDTRQLKSELNNVTEKKLNSRSAKDWNLILHTSLFRKYLLSVEQQNNLGDAIIELNTLFPDSKPDEIPIYRKNGDAFCPELVNRTRILSLSGIQEQIPVNYVIFPSGLIMKFLPNSNNELVFDWIQQLTPSDICLEITTAQEMESYPTNIKALREILLATIDQRDISEDTLELLISAQNEIPPSTD